MNAVKLTPAAYADLFEIGQIIRQDNPGAAELFVDDLTAIFERLAAMPEIGREIPEIRAGLRRHPFRRFNIYYELTGTGILVVRVLHSARDASALLS
ncbi:type II toxin-antitoxin system RelE/ParE family toxin [Govanella unica]|uniref:Type II toxin-antitoxin system RelE/ParE family toxin n=1 Tax=Govanella unica TaxID=2975056 RepID=A0A9X3TY64_9PROT|nr:type II toxin-antitoxin system RelE/ParE family toxin [Govania unica]MDA5193704.1 type II toxin-antitoxin system RelE/ParE family toxin [Govania unica]